jgi:hypothetical protein
MVDANYAVASSTGSSSATAANRVLNILQASDTAGATLKSTTQLRVLGGQAGAVDSAEYSVAIFR